MGKVRDAKQAERPEGCWCLGIGGTHHRTLTNGETIFQDTCVCPEGLAEKERARRERVAEGERFEKSRIKTMWNQSGIPARFIDFRLDSSPVLAEKHDLKNKLTPPAIPSTPDDVLWDAWGTQLNGWLSSWVFYGGYGTGKTGLAVGLAHAWINADDEIRSLSFVSVPRMLSELRDTYNTNQSEQKVIDKYAEAGLLILDDMGAEQVKNTGWVEDRLYQIIGERHDELRPTIFTSNLNLDQLAGRIGERVTWRIVEMVGKDNIIHVDGPNLRDL